MIEKIEQLIRQYYQPLFDYLDLTPKVSPENLDILRYLERKYKVTIPDSMKAWYSIDGWKDILDDYGSFDHIDTVYDFFIDAIWDDVTAEEVSSEVFQRIQQYNQWLDNNQLVSVFGEHQGMVGWYVFIDGKSDPKVLTYLDEPPYLLVDFPHSFSELIYIHIWDNKLLGYLLKGYIYRFCGGEDWLIQLSFLQKHFKQLPTTDLRECWKRDRQIFRFQSGEMYVSCWKEDKPNFTLYADDLEVFKELLRLFIDTDVFMNARNGLTKKLNAVYSNNDKVK